MIAVAKVMVCGATGSVISERGRGRKRMVEYLEFLIDLASRQINARAVGDYAVYSAGMLTE